MLTTFAVIQVEFTGKIINIIKWIFWAKKLVSQITVVKVREVMVNHMKRHRKQPVIIHSFP